MNDSNKIPDDLQGMQKTQNINIKKYRDFHLENRLKELNNSFTLLSSFNKLNYNKNIEQLDKN